MGSRRTRDPAPSGLALGAVAARATPRPGLCPSIERSQLPLSPPYTPEVQDSLARWMPPGSGLEPLKLFRTIARHARLSQRMRGLGSVFLGHATIPLRTRELLILRTCAGCGAEYEWGVHVTAFAATAGLDDEAIRGTVSGAPDGNGADALVLRLVDELHDAGSVTEVTWTGLAAHHDSNALLEMLAVVGFYQLVSFVVNGARVEREPWAATFPVADPSRA